MRVMSRLAGRIRRRRKCERIAALGLVLVRRLPWRQVTGRALPRPAARTRCLNVTGGSGMRVGVGVPAGVGGGERGLRRRDGRWRPGQPWTV